MSGIKLAALYGIKPHKLGFCGPKDKKDTQLLSDYLKGARIKENKIRVILKEFKGAYPYYKLIAKSNGIKDFFDKRVIKAYWVGNKLLDKVEKIKPHHSYHVLVVGSVTGRIVLKGKLLDLCRIGWGRVIKLKVKSQKLKIEYCPLIGKKKFKLGKTIKKEIEWDRDLLPKVKTGDWVSFHWNQAVEILTNKDIKNLRKYTLLTLNSL